MEYLLDLSRHFPLALHSVLCLGEAPAYQYLNRKKYIHNIRIYHECEGRIEKSVPRIAVWHLEACRVMTNVDP